jgi:hypothetical protein
MDDSKNISPVVVQHVTHTNDYDNIEYNENPTAQNCDNPNYEVQNMIGFLR